MVDESAESSAGSRRAEGSDDHPLTILVVHDIEADAEALSVLLTIRTPANVSWIPPSLPGAFRADVILVPWRCYRGDLVEELGASPTCVYGVEEQASAVVACLRSGAVACATASCAVDDLIDVLRRVGRGAYALSDTAVRLLAQSFGERCATYRSTTLTLREREALALLSRGCCNKEIAVALSIRLPTVKNHLRSAFEKLGVHSRAEAIVLLNGSAAAALEFSPEKTASFLRN
jgi:DNA-binding CsgD family transcriptional regulator